jgi:large subunit ribosomal protein L29
MKHRERIEELKKLSSTELKDRCKSMGEELMKLRFRKAAGRLEKPHVLAQVRKDLARVKTFINQQTGQQISKEIGIEAPKKTETKKAAKKVATKKTAN